MSDVALFGGGFDPIGLHHELIAERIFDICKMPVWLMPCYQHKFSKNSRLQPPEHRLHMVEVCSNEKMSAFDWEIKNHHDGSMFETLQCLKREFSNTNFHIAIGMDNANNIEKWDRGNILIQEHPFIVLGRETAETDWFLQSPHRYLECMNSLSSTDIRHAIEIGDYEAAERALNPKVWAYIQKEELYGYHP